jgi:hypothetical protein
MVFQKRRIFFREEENWTLRRIFFPEKEES